MLLQDVRSSLPCVCIEHEKSSALVACAEMTALCSAEVRTCGVCVHDLQDKEEAPL